MSPRRTDAQAVHRSWSMFPSKHDDVVRLLQEANLCFTFNRNDSDAGTLQECDTNIKGRFQCTNPACRKVWVSGIVATTIRMYANRRYNARVYSQRCKGCNRPCRPFLDQSYEERVAYRLKKWSGIAMELPAYTERATKQPPHESGLCEGCRHRRCRLAN